MKDLTPILPGDLALAERERLGLRGGLRPMGAGKRVAGDGERASVLAEQRMAEKRRRFEVCAPVAHDVLEEARAALAVRFRYFDQALWRMPLVADFEISGIASNGASMFYDPVFVVNRFKVSPNEVVRDVIHCLFHCIFRHPFMLYSVLRQPWDVACDIAIESILLDLVGEAFPSNMDRRARESLKLICAKMGGVVTAERLYWFFSNEGSAIDLRSLSPLFFHDAHGLWYASDGDDASRGTRGAARQETLDSEGGALPETAGQAPFDASTGGEGWEAEDDGKGGDGGESDEREAPNPNDEATRELAEQWEDISRRIQTEIEAQVSRRGDEVGSFATALAAVNRERCDYTAFLKRFATLHERMRVNPDEFDYVYYTFGLERYGNMPLIEPLEYREDRSVRDFAIAIDTSESVSGETVQAFMRKTYNILKQAESFHDRVNIHLIQCDARVQEDTKITSLDQLDCVIESLKLKGFGGTDFRPVFEYVNLLVEKREFSDLQGLVYFTDGQGTFPRRKPAYDAVFVFVDDGYSDPPVPPWAYKVILRDADLAAEAPGSRPRGAAASERGTARGARAQGLRRGGGLPGSGSPGVRGRPAAIPQHDSPQRATKGDV